MTFTLTTFLHSLTCYLSVFVLHFHLHCRVSMTIAKSCAAYATTEDHLANVSVVVCIRTQLQHYVHVEYSNVARYTIFMLTLCFAAVNRRMTTSRRWVETAAVDCQREHWTTSVVTLLRPRPAKHYHRFLNNIIR